MAQVRRTLDTLLAEIDAEISLMTRERPNYIREWREVGPAGTIMRLFEEGSEMDRLRKLRAMVQRHKDGEHFKR